MKGVAKIGLCTIIYVSICHGLAFGALIYNGQYVTGITNLQIGLSYYDVDFVNGIAEDVFLDDTSGLWKFDFTTITSANEAANAVNAALGTEYIDVGNNMTYYIPMYITYIDYYGANKIASRDNIHYSPTWIDPSVGIAYLHFESAYNYAVFTPSAVPITGSVWLLGSGIVGLVGLRRRCSTTV